MRIIGIDPGTLSCGYGIVELQKSSSDTPAYIVAGNIRMKKGEDLPGRLHTLYQSLKAIMAEYRPGHLCIEKIFYHKSIPSALALGSTRGIAMLLAAEQAIPVYEYNSTQLKKALTGYGRAEKRQVQEMVKRILNLNVTGSSLSEDATDALALCICHIHTADWSQEFKDKETRKEP